MSMLLAAIGALLIGLGVLSIIPRYAKMLIRIRNNFNGTKTNITNTSVLLSKISGVIAVIIGIFLIFAALSS